MPLPKGHVANFRTLTKAAKNDDIVLIECTDAKTGEPVSVVAMVNRPLNPKTGQNEFEFVPVARLFDGNPYEQLIPPTA